MNISLDSFSVTQLQTRLSNFSKQKRLATISKVKVKLSIVKFETMQCFGLQLTAVKSKTTDF